MEEALQQMGFPDIDSEGVQKILGDHGKDKSGSLGPAEFRACALRLISNRANGDLVRTVICAIGALEVLTQFAYFVVPRCEQCTEGSEEIFDHYIYPRFLSGIYLVVICEMVGVGIRASGPKRLVDFWVALFARPLDLFEKINIRGTQIASIFYFTESDEPKEKVTEPADAGSGCRRSIILNY